MQPEARPFVCSYELDGRLDRELVKLNQATYRLLQRALSQNYELKLGPDGMPDAIQYYLLYVAALIYGASDAVLTLTLHNLGREARILERQIFEYWLRAAYYADRPDEARVALHSTPFQEKQLLDQLQYSKDSERYRQVAKMCDEIETALPEAARYREPSVQAIIDPKSNADLARFYAVHYRAASQMAHASFNGVGGVWGVDGLSFDSRLENPNFSLVQVTTYLLAFITMLDEKLQLSMSKDLEDLKGTFRLVQERILTEMQTAH